MSRVASILWALTLAASSACASDYEGEIYDQVVNANEIGMFEVLPEGYRIIGEVFADNEEVLDGSSFIDQLRCNASARFTRRNRRAAAQSGGELLIEHGCIHEEFEDFSPWHDDPNTEEIETALSCWTACSGLVARSWAVDDG